MGEQHSLVAQERRLPPRQRPHLRWVAIFHARIQLGATKRVESLRLRQQHSAWIATSLHLARC